MSTPSKTIKKEPVKREWFTREIKLEDLPYIYVLLKAPFPLEAIKEGTTHYGLKVKGIRSQYIVDRLNDVLGINHWNYTYNSVDEARGKVYAAKCDITIQIGNWIHPIDKESRFIPLASHSYVGGCNHMDKYEAHKGAITNAMKKCASIFGIASDIYKGISDPDLIENGQSQKEMPEAQTEKEVQVIQTEEEEPLPIGEKGGTFAQLLTELNSVKDKTTYIKTKEMMDAISSELEPDQMEIAVKALVELEKKFRTT